MKKKMRVMAKRINEKLMKKNKKIKLNLQKTTRTSIAAAAAAAAATTKTTDW